MCLWEKLDSKMLVRETPLDNTYPLMRCFIHGKKFLLLPFHLHCTADPVTASSVDMKL